jgi:hypothetical protein
MELLGQKETLADAGPYRVLLYLEAFAAKQLGVDPKQPLVVTFDNSEEALTFHAIARSKSTELILPWGPGKQVILQPVSWGMVTLQTPQGVIVTPGVLSVSGVAHA